MPVQAGLRDLPKGPQPEAKDHARPGGSVLVSRIASLTRTLDERDRTIDGLLQRLDASRSAVAQAVATCDFVDTSRCRACDTVDALEARNQSLKEALDRSRHADKLASIGRLATGIAHELNTPIQYIADNFSFIEHAFATLLDVLDRCRLALEGEGVPDAAAMAGARGALAQADVAFVCADLPDAVLQSREGLQRIAATVAALRRFSNPSRGTAEPVDLRELVDATVAIARHEWRYVADVELDFEEGLPPVPCLRDEIGGVILNLLINAAQAIGRHARQPRGRIVIAVRATGDWAEIRVSDDGGGIPEHLRAHLFDPEVTTASLGEGVGQGLALVHDCVVERHGGAIDVHSEPGKGSTFTVRLPMQVPVSRTAA